MFSKKEEKKSEEIIRAEEANSKNLREEMEKNYNFFAMPEHFRNTFEVQGTKKAGIFIMVFGIIFLLAASAGLYWFLFMKNGASDAKVNNNVVQNNQAPTTTEPVAVKEEPKESAVDAYKRLRREGVNAPNATSTNPGINEMGTVEEASKTDNSSSLVAKTTDGLRSGTIKMVLSGTNWQIESEIWSEPPIPVVSEVATSTASTTTQTEATTTEVSSMKPGVDAEGDMLTDEEEKLFGTDPLKNDTDGDGFDDLAEIMNLYNPAGNGKLVGTAAKIYENKTYKYSFVYPSAWQIADSDPMTVMVKSLDGQMMLISTDDNKDKLSIEEWYKKEFSVAEIVPENIVKGNDWTGIMSSDLINLYLTDKENKKIYSISYNPGESNILNYPNVFKLIIKTFTLK